MSTNMIIGWIFTIIILLWALGLAIYGVYILFTYGDDNDDRWPHIDQDTLITIIGAAA